jgi:hypothetical protein
LSDAITDALLRPRDGLAKGCAVSCARRHREEAGRLGLDVHVISRGPWTRDVDHPEDLKDLPDSV